MTKNKKYITKKSDRLKNLGQKGLKGSKDIFEYSLPPPEFFNLKDSDIVIMDKKYKKGGLVTKGKPKLAKKGWK